MSETDLMRWLKQWGQVESPLAENPAPEPPANTPPAPEETPPPPPPTTPPQVNPSLPQPAPVKSIKSADELAAIVLSDLRNVEGCPKAGVNVVIYGSNPWNAWLSFGAAAGPVHNKTELQAICEIITDRLKRLYDVVA